MPNRYKKTIKKNNRSFSRSKPASEGVTAENTNPASGALFLKAVNAPGNQDKDMASAISGALTKGGGRSTRQKAEGIEDRLDADRRRRAKNQKDLIAKALSNNPDAEYFQGVSGREGLGDYPKRRRFHNLDESEKDNIVSEYPKNRATIGSIQKQQYTQGLPMSIASENRRLAEEEAERSNPSARSKRVKSTQMDLTRTYIKGAIGAVRSMNKKKNINPDMY